MVKHESPKKPACGDWHKADIKAALEKAGWSLRALSRQHGLTHGAVASALYRRYPTAEKKIAIAIGVPASQIWPTRYNADGSHISALRGNPNWRTANSERLNHAPARASSKAKLIQEI